MTLTPSETHFLLLGVQFGLLVGVSARAAWMLLGWVEDFFASRKEVRA